MASLGMNAQWVQAKQILITNKECALSTAEWIWNCAANYAKLYSVFSTSLLLPCNHLDQNVACVSLLSRTSQLTCIILDSLVKQFIDVGRIFKFRAVFFL